jgi:hypothetical protein
VSNGGERVDFGMPATSRAGLRSLPDVGAFGRGRALVVHQTPGQGPRGLQLSPPLVKPVLGKRRAPSGRLF